MGADRRGRRRVRAVPDSGARRLDARFRTPGGPGLLAAVASAALLSGAALGPAEVSAAPRPGYAFLLPQGDPPVNAAAAAPRWSEADFPLRFQLLENSAFFKQGDSPRHYTVSDGTGLLTEAGWRRIVQRAVAAWSEIPTAHIGVSLEESVHVPDREADFNDGKNTIGFDSSEEIGVNAFAAVRIERGVIRECDIRVNIYTVEGLDHDPVKHERFLQRLVTHETGHCLGLAHSEHYPVWLAAPPDGSHPEATYPHGVRAFRLNPIMSYGWVWGPPELTRDDAVAASLLYPGAGFRESHGAVGGRVLFESGDPVPYVYVQAVESAAPDGEFGPGAFTDEDGQFLVEGLRPGTVLLWVRPMLDPGSHSGQDVDLVTLGRDVRDRWRWGEAAAGGIALVPDITVARGRIP